MNTRGQIVRRIVVMAFVMITLALPLCMFPGSNVYSRVGMIFQVIDQGTLDIGPWAQKTNDASTFEGKAYNGKAPGSAFIGIPAYALAKSLAYLVDAELNYDMARYLVRILTLLPLCLLAAWLGMKYLNQMKGEDLLFTPGWLLGTTAFPFSIVLFGHQYAACMLLIAFFCLYQHKHKPAQKQTNLPWLAGLFCGLAILTEYPSALIALFLGLYLLSYERKLTHILTFGIIGVGLPLVGIGLYNWACFSSPFTFGYQSLAYGGYSEGMSDGLLGVGLPRWSAFWEVTFSLQSGLFFNAPYLLFAPIGIIALLADKEKRAEGILFAAVILGFLAFNAGYWEPGGAMSFGPRHLVPAIPFFALAAFYGGTAVYAWLKQVFYGFLVISIFITSLGTFADPLMPDRLTNPFYEFALPLLANGFGVSSFFGANGIVLFLIFAIMSIVVGIVLYVSREHSFPGVSVEPVLKIKPFLVSTLALLLVYVLALPLCGKTEPGMKFQVFGNYHMSRNEYSPAEKYYEKAAGYRRDPHIHYYRGIALGKTGRNEEMVTEFKTVLDMAPDYPNRESLLRMIEVVEKGQSQ